MFTSANSADEEPVRTQAQVADYIPEGIDLVIPGEPGEIRDLMSQQVIRGQ